MKGWLITILIGLLVGVIVGVILARDGEQETSPLPTLPGGWERYHNEEYDYSVGYPEGWTKEEVAYAVSFYEPTTVVNFNIMVGTTQETDLEKYVAANRIPTWEGATYLSEGRVVINGREGYEMILTLYFSVGTRQGLMKHRQVVFLVNGKGYVLTCTASEAAYNQYADVFDTVINSFIVK